MCIGPTKLPEAEWLKLKEKYLRWAEEDGDLFYANKVNRIQAERDAIAKAQAEVKPTTKHVLGVKQPEWLKPRIIQANGYAPIHQPQTATH